MLVRSFIAFVMVWVQSVALVGSLPAFATSPVHTDTMDCVLCELALSSGDESLIGSCDCGCWSSTDRIPEAPSGVIVNVERQSATRAPERASIVAAGDAGSARAVAPALGARAYPHCDVLGFLALIGVWLN
jgi:hypothetical protein